MSESASAPLLDMALSMYANEPCRICGIVLSLDDVKTGAVFAGYSQDNTSRAAHKRCWLGMVDVLQSLVGLHKHPPELELTQIAAICLNWLEMRQEKETK